VKWKALSASWQARALVGDKDFVRPGWWRRGSALENNFKDGEFARLTAVLKSLSRRQKPSTSLQLALLQITMQVAADISFIWMKKPGWRDSRQP
jgi:hypothetical protein